MSSLAPSGFSVPACEVELRWWSGEAASSLLCWAWRVGEEGRGRGRLRWASGQRPCPHRRMAHEEGWSLREVRARVGASHGITDLAHKLHFYDQWAPDYDQVNWA